MMLNLQEYFTQNVGDRYKVKTRFFRFWTEVGSLEFETLTPELIVFSGSFSLLGHVFNGKISIEVIDDTKCNVVTVGETSEEKVREATYEEQDGKLEISYKNDKCSLYVEAGLTYLSGTKGLTFTARIEAA